MRERILAETLTPAGLVHVVAARRDLRPARSAFAFFAPHALVVEWPHRDCLPYDRVSPSPEVAAARAAVLSLLGEPRDRPLVMVATAAGALERLPPPRARTLILEAGALDLDALAQWLEREGYSAAEPVLHPGDYALRGERMELWPAGTDGAVTLAPELDQRLVLRPASELMLDAQRFVTAWAREFGPAPHPIPHAVAEGRRPEGLEHWAPLLHERMVALFDTLPGAPVSLGPGVEAAIADFRAQVGDSYADRCHGRGDDGALPPYCPLPPERQWLTEAEWRQVPMPDHEAPFLQPNDDDVEPEHWMAEAEHRTLVAAAETPVARRQFARWLEEAGLPFQPVTSFAEARALPRGTLALAILDLAKGFMAEDWAVLTRRECLGGPPPVERRRWSLIAESLGLTVGDVVVHLEYGIGRLDGLEVVEAEGVPYEALRLVYRNGDKVLVPCDDAELVWRHGPAGDEAALDTLRTETWAKRRERVAEEVGALAGHLLELAAERQRASAPVLPVPADYGRFTRRFPHDETPGQSEAVAAVETDLASGRPMDRVVVGDVGFGKTEVALRAAFIAARNGQQVAVVVPTTPLARQHCETFRARCAGFPIRIGQISRGIGAPRAKANKRLAEEGALDIVIGTHGVLDVRFPRLGLAILDEEQRLGVRQKERLKALGSVHVLAMSATPIPRTLEWALAGLKDLSVISTPPVERRPVRTFAVPWDPVVVRQALLREARRGGQSFVVCPRLAGLDQLARELAELVPELSRVTAHGKMAAGALDDAMTAFAEGAKDILLATNIIESGLDIPAANTLVVVRAELFGLAQLHQLRGRVGRGGRQAFAYFTWEPAHPPGAASRQRLEALSALDQPGAGVLVAGKDRDLRGAGALLGEEQAGRIADVGAELYQHMLAAAVRAARGQAPEPMAAPKVELGLPALLPPDYVPAPQTRIAYYRRMAAAGADLAGILDELEERFGPVPWEARSLVGVIRLKQLARRAGVTAVEGGPKGIVLELAGEREFASLLARYPQLEQRADASLVLRGDFAAPRLRLKTAGGLLKAVAKAARYTATVPPPRAP